MAHDTLLLLPLNNGKSPSVSDRH